MGLDTDTLYKSFSDMGLYLILLGVLYIVSLFLGFVPYGGIITSVLLLVFYIMFLLSLKNVNQILNNPDLNSAYTKLVIGFAIPQIGTIIAAIAVFPFMASMMQSGGSGSYTLLASLLTILLIVLAMMVIGYILMMLGWGSLQLFFSNNQHLFPPGVGMQAYSGASNIKTGYILMALVFLIITVPIGFIFLLIGYFKLGNALYSLKNVSTPPRTMTAPPQSPAPAPAPSPAPAPAPSPSVDGNVQTPKYCPTCGAELRPGVRFCPSCGSRLF